MVIDYEKKEVKTENEIPEYYKGKNGYLAKDVV